jgi:serine/threonine protein kinase
MGRQVQRAAAREVRVLRGLRHDNVVRLLEAFRAGARLFLVFELAEQTVLQVGGPSRQRDTWQLCCSCCCSNVRRVCC